MSFIIAIIVLILDVFAILKIAQSSATIILKAVWIVLVLVLPFIGLIIWYFVGPGDKSFKM